MSGNGFERSQLLDQLGLDHGFGTRDTRPESVAGLCSVKQVHGTTLLRVPEAPAGAAADALFTTHPGCAVGVFTADCVPILIADGRRRVVAAVHAGWRGSAAGIAQQVVLALARELAGDTAELAAAIGPHIGPCCYEVDQPVRGVIAEASVFRPVRAGRYMLDLFELNRLQLVRAGIAAQRIERVGGCTCCEARYESYRRDGRAGRMLHFARMWLS